MGSIYAAKPWLAGYKLGPYKLPQSLQPYPEAPVFKMLDDSAASYPSRVAIEYETKRITYRELKDYADKLANALNGLGIGKGKKVAMVLPNCPQYIIGDFGILKTGATVIPCSILHKEPTLVWEISESGAETVICQVDSLDLIRQVAPKTKLKNIIITSTKDFSPEESATPERIPGTINLRDLLAEHEAIAPEVDINPASDLAYICFTGGSTGMPKGVMLTHFNRYTNIQQGIPWVYTPLATGVKGRASVLIPIPLFHVYGHWAMQSSIYWGLHIYLIREPRDTETTVRLMQEHRPLLAFCVPTQLMRMVEKKIGRMPVMAMSCAAPLPLEVSEAISSDLMMPVSEGYGLTEMSTVSHMNLLAFSKITGFAPRMKLSMGLPVPDTEAKVVDTESGKECPVGEMGELYLRGPQTMMGFWPTPGSGLIDGWLPTGDLVKMDTDGYFYVLDRKKDMANISGFKVYTTEIDTVLFEHPAVKMAAAIGVPDPARPGSERIKAFIILKEGKEDTVTAAELIEHCREKVPPYAVPQSIEFRNDLHLTPTEKLWKRILREEEIEKMKAAGDFEKGPFIKSGGDNG